MGIEYIADATLVSRVQWVTNEGKRCVRFLCENTAIPANRGEPQPRRRSPWLDRGQLTRRPVQGSLDWSNGIFVPYFMP